MTTSSKAKGRESKVKSATRQLDGLDFQRPEVRSELVDIVEKRVRHICNACIAPLTFPKRIAP